MSYYELLDAVSRDDLKAVKFNLAREKFSANDLAYICTRTRSTETKRILIGQVETREDKKAFFLALLRYKESDFAISLQKNKWLQLDGEERIEALFKAKENDIFDYLKYCVFEEAIDLAVYNNSAEGILEGIGGPYGLQDNEGPYGLEDRDKNEKAKIDIFLIQQGALKNPKNAAYVEEVIRKYLEITVRSKEKPRPFVEELCREIIQYVSRYDRESFPLKHKQLAISCALILKNNELLEKFTQQLSFEEDLKIKRFRDSLTEAPASLEVKKCHEIYHPNPQYNFVYLRISELLQNTALCIEILKGLEAELAEKYEENNIDVSKYINNPDDYIFFNLPWPILKNFDSHVKTHSILHHILLEKERRHGINEDPDAPILFADFIPTHVANSYIEAGNVFSEYNYSGNLLHGKYSHRLQWYIFLRAKELGLISTNNLSAKQLLCESASVWAALFDLYPLNLDAQNLGFRSPFYLHSALLSLKERLPCLSGTLRKIYSRSIEVVSRHQSENTSFEKICTEYDILKQGYRTLCDRIPSELYYQANNKENKLRIVYQRNEENYASAFFVRKRFKREHPTQEKEPLQVSNQ